MTTKEFFDALPGRAEPEKLAGIEATYLFDIAGEGRWLVEIHDGTVAVTEDPSGGADVQFSLSAETFSKLLARKQNPMVAYMTGKLKVKGDVNVAMHLQSLLPG
jgi:putative sterol carrier protein